MRTQLVLAILVAGLAWSIRLPHEVLAQSAPLSVPSTGTHTRHVVLVMTDGLRWQEVFRGADTALISKSGGRNKGDLKRRYWRDSLEARRAALFPFLWGTLVREGQLFGNKDAGSIAEVTNEYRSSYPGYSETFSGVADPRVDGNSHGDNENTTVFEWLNHQSGFRGKVAAFATWGVFQRIFNTPRSGLPVYDGWHGVSMSASSSRMGIREGLWAAILRLGSNNGRDALTQQKAIDYAITRQPRVLFVGFGETDEDAHNGHYDKYLQAAHNVDTYLKQLWDTLQANPEYRDRTTMIVTTDHGRGNGAKWSDHGAAIDGAEDIWLAAIGPDTPALGMRTNIEPVQQSQVAATIAALVGRDFVHAIPGVAPPLAEVLPLPFVASERPAVPPTAPAHGRAEGDTSTLRKGSHSLQKVP